MLRNKPLDLNNIDSQTSNEFKFKYASVMIQIKNYANFIIESEVNDLMSKILPAICSILINVCKLKSKRIATRSNKQYPPQLLLTLDLCLTSINDFPLFSLELKEKLIQLHFTPEK